jgi:hypothetical protein
MSDSNANPPVGDSSASSGQETNQQADVPKKDSVAYETYQKVLSEKKKTAERLAILEAEKADREKKDMEAKGEYQKLIELEKKRADEAIAKVSAFEEQMTQGKKLRALLNALGGQVDDKFLGFLPIDQIALDPETKDVNLTSVASVADQIKKQYPEFIKNPNAPRLPNMAPQGNEAGKISEAEWKKLSAKEMAKYSSNQIIWGN